jgi:hypothetical protein
MLSALSHLVGHDPLPPTAALHSTEEGPAGCCRGMCSPTQTRGASRRPLTQSWPAGPPTVAAPASRWPPVLRLCNPRGFRGTSCEAPKSISRQGSPLPRTPHSHRGGHACSPWRDRPHAVGNALRLLGEPVRGPSRPIWVAAASLQNAPVSLLGVCGAIGG